MGIWHGLARQGKARQGKARQSKAKQGRKGGKTHLETVNHLDKFIPNLATVIEPSTGLLRKDTELFQCHMNKIKHVDPVQEKNCNPIQKSYLSEL